MMVDFPTLSYGKSIIYLNWLKPMETDGFVMQNLKIIICSFSD